jgi:hypothetical protein
MSSVFITPRQRSCMVYFGTQVGLSHHVGGLDLGWLYISMMLLLQSVKGGVAYLQASPGVRGTLPWERERRPSCD